MKMGYVGSSGAGRICMIDIRLEEGARGIGVIGEKRGVGFVKI